MGRKLPRLVPLSGLPRQRRALTKGLHGFGFGASRERIQSSWRAGHGAPGSPQFSLVSMVCDEAVGLAVGQRFEVLVRSSKSSHLHAPQRNLVLSSSSSTSLSLNRYRLPAVVPSPHSEVFTAGAGSSLRTKEARVTRLGSLGSIHSDPSRIMESWI